MLDIAQDDMATNAGVIREREAAPARLLWRARKVLRNCCRELTQTLHAKRDGRELRRGIVDVGRRLWASPASNALARIVADNDRLLRGVIEKRRFVHAAATSYNGHQLPNRLTFTPALVTVNP
jgi:hypothetical protein